MAKRRPNEPPPIVVRTFTHADIERGITKLRRRIDEVQRLNPREISCDDAAVRTVETNIRETIREVFGPQSPEFDDYQGHSIWHDSNDVEYWGDERQAQFAAGIPQTVTMIEGLIARLEEKREDAEAVRAPATHLRPAPSESRVIFIVHGRDEAAKEAVARFLEKLDLRATILHEQANQGRTLIEKFETNADVGFAVVLLTPDDTGFPGTKSVEAKPRARQNVIFEFGYFVGRIGRARVCALHKGGVELPSDLQGIVYVPMDDSGSWQVPLARELNAAGMDVDLNRVI